LHYAKIILEAALEFFELKSCRACIPYLVSGHFICEILFKKDAAVVVSVMRTIWGSRNSYNHGEVKYQPLKSMDLVDELIKAIDIMQSQIGTRGAKWAQPEHSWIKLNFDGALKVQQNVVRVGVVVCGHDGAFVLAECRKYEHTGEPSMPGMPSGAYPSLASRVPRTSGLEPLPHNITCDTL
jgi:hypothetical protein